MRRILSLSLFLFLLGCGGGGGGSAPPQNQPPPPALNPAGLWIGNTNTNRDFECLVLSNNSMFCLYSLIGDPTIIAGAIHGNGIVSGNTFTANNTHDFSLEVNSALAIPLTATFNPKQSFSGSIQPSGVSFVLGYDSRYDLTPSLANVVGSFGGSAAAIPGNGGEFAGAAVNTNGALAISSSLDGTIVCEASGALSPRTDGNAFNASLTFGAGCIYQGQTFNGAAFYDIPSTQLTIIVTNSTRNAAALFAGIK